MIILLYRLVPFLYPSADLGPCNIDTRERVIIYFAGAVKRDRQQEGTSPCHAEHTLEDATETNKTRRMARRREGVTEE